MSFAPTDRLASVRLIEETPRARSAEVQQELDVALFDLVEANSFRLVGRAAVGPYVLGLGMAERMLRFEVAAGDGAPAVELVLSLSPLRGVIKDYFAICDSYFDAVKRLTPERIEAIDMGRRGIHDEGARILAERLAGKIDTDHDTARRLFTVICALQARG